MAEAKSLWGHAKLGVRLLKETQLINKLGAEECESREVQHTDRTPLAIGRLRAGRRFLGFAPLPRRRGIGGALG